MWNSVMSQMCVYVKTYMCKCVYTHKKRAVYTHAQECWVGGWWLNFVYNIFKVNIVRINELTEIGPN